MALRPSSLAANPRRAASGRTLDDPEGSPDDPDQVGSGGGFLARGDLILDAAAASRGRLIPVGPGPVGTGSDAPVGTGSEAPVGTRRDPPVRHGLDVALMLSFSPGDPPLFPIQPAKIQRPPLRDETLPRGRLLDWLAAKIHHRAVLVVAEAGYGKTTLLADFARRTRLRTFWYRLDEQDRDPVAFMNYLVAAGRVLAPEFAPTTAALLRELGVGGVSHETLVGTFVRELAGLGPEPAALIVDDYHLVDDVPEVRSIVQALLRDGPERLSVVILSRRPARLSVARLRTQGEIVELSTDDLRFRTDETERLFRESYGRPLEPDVLDELSLRTEGWAASLQLVQTAIRDRSPSEVRSFVRGLSGTHDELYDYLAEEVVADLEAPLRRFLMRTAILRIVEPDLAVVAADVDDATARRSIETAERLGLLGRRGDSRWSHRYHPLVQEFLVERLTRAEGLSAVLALHRTVARYAEDVDWRLAVHHWAAAGDGADVHRVLAVAIPSVMGTGEFALAESYLERFPPPERTPVFEVFLSRLDFYRNRLEMALDRARWAAAEAEPGARDAGIANLMSLEFMHGNLTAAADLARVLKGQGRDELYRQIGEGILTGLAASADGALSETVATLERMSEVHRSRGLRHFLGITLNNIVSVKLAQGDADGAARVGDEAREELEASSAGPELAGLLAMRGLALAQLGRSAESAACFDQARGTDHLLARAEVLITEADAETWYGSEERAAQLLAEAEETCVTPELKKQWLAAHHSLQLRKGDDEANRQAPSVDEFTWSSRPGERSRAFATLAHLRAASGAAFHEELRRGLRQAKKQGAKFWERYLRMLAGAYGGPAHLNEAISEASRLDPSHISLLAETVARRLPDLTSRSLSIVEAEAISRKPRWQEALRRALDDPAPPVRLSAGRLLDIVGTADDVRRLRRLSRALRGRYADPTLGRALARSLAPPVFVEDLGMVRITVGSRSIRGTDIRRKPLSLLCYLLSRPNFVATRDQVLDALWPDQEPGDGQNSLNQTLYFLRRVFDPSFDEDLSATYVRLDSDLLWLDRELVDSRSNRCRAIMQRISTTDAPEPLDELVAEYRGRFALDFAYEDWSSAFRGSLHSGFLEAVERGVRRYLSAAEGERALALARAALEVDPDADHVELSLLRVYGATGAYAAAAEQYDHYASHLRREFDEEPPPLDAIQQGFDR